MWKYKSTAITTFFLLLCAFCNATIYTVINTNNTGAGSLRQAIINANANPGADEIRFNIAGAGPHTITLTSALPTITESIIINGASQSGTWDGDNTTRTLNLFLTTSSAANFDCFNFSGTVNNIEINDLAIGGFKGAAIAAASSSVINTLFVWGCYFGTRVDGTTTAGNFNDILINPTVTIQKLQIGVNSDNNGAWKEPNLFAASKKAAISVQSPLTTLSIIAGNYFGLLKNGTTAASTCVTATTETGNIELINTSKIVIGCNLDQADDWAEKNIIASADMGVASLIRNLSHGIFVNNSSQIWISDNFIGTDITGALPKSNFGKGIQLTNCNTITIGFDDSKSVFTAFSATNIISANKAGGIGVTDGQYITIANNYIGTNANGSLPLGNGDVVAGKGDGINCNGICSNIVIGCDGDDVIDEYEENYICNNALSGINVVGNNYKISGNHIGETTAHTPFGNGLHGIVFANGRNNLIGSDGTYLKTYYQHNFIMANAGDALRINNVYKTKISGNFVGMADDGSVGIYPNGGHGLNMKNSDSCTIGATANEVYHEYQKNFFSNCMGDGVNLEDVNNTLICHNFIGTGIDGALDRGNKGAGIRIKNCKKDTIGTNGDLINDGLERNIISYNLQNGIDINNAGIAGNFPLVINNNLIGITIAGLASTTSGNKGYGIYVLNANNMLIGTNGDGKSDNLERNSIQGNGLDGLYMKSCLAPKIANNHVGIATYGSDGEPNGGNGIYLTNCDNAIIGTNSDGISDNIEKNVLSNNNLSGLSVNISNNIKVAGNFIGVASYGGDLWGNKKNGVEMVDVQFVTIGTNGDNVSDVLERNVISNNNNDGINFTNTSKGNISNNYIGVASWGFQNFGNKGNGISLNNASDIVIGTNGNGISDLNEKNVIGYNQNSGIKLNQSFNNRIANNYVGEGSDGFQDCPNNNGIELIDANNNFFGTNSDGISDYDEVNVIAGNTGYGVIISGSQSYKNVFYGNYIGIAKYDNEIRPNIGAAMVIQNGAFNNIIGSDGNNVNDDNERNYIANNGKGLIVRGNNTFKNRISKNSFYDNGGPAIDLGNFDGVSPNDGVTVATANNIGLDYPVITFSYLASASNLKISGYIGDCTGSFATPGSVLAMPLTVELYEADNTPADQNGLISTSACGNITYPHAEGRNYLGSFTTTTGIFNNQNITTAIPVVYSNNITAIAIDALGNTSEFGPLINLIVLDKDDKNFVVKLNTQNKALLNYQGNLIDVKTVIVQKSSDGINWIDCSVNNETKSGTAFSAIDNNPNLGKSFYRLVFTTLDGNKTFSSIKSILVAETEANYSVYPTITNNTISIFQNKKIQPITITLLNSNGQIVKNYTTTAAKFTISDFANYTAGTYLVKIANSTKVQIFKIQVQH
jgi:hypothetical protein